MIREASLLPPFIPLGAAAKWANGLLLANVALAWVAVGIALSELHLLARATVGDAVAPLERAAQFATNEWLGVVQAALFIATAVAFLMWLHHARGNIRALGVRRPHFGSEWVYLSFLVPLLNLVRPYQVVQEIWQASDPGNLDAFNWKNLAVPRLLPLWWGLFAAYLGVAGLAELTALGAGVSLARLELTTGVVLAANGLGGLAAGAAYLVVTRISDDQEAKYARLLASGEEKPACEDEDETPA